MTVVATRRPNAALGHHLVIEARLALIGTKRVPDIPRFLGKSGQFYHCAGRPVRLRDIVRDLQTGDAAEKANTGPTQRFHLYVLDVASTTGTTLAQDSREPFGRNFAELLGMSKTHGGAMMHERQTEFQISQRTHSVASFREEYCKSGVGDSILPFHSSRR